MKSLGRLFIPGCRYLILMAVVPFTTLGQNLVYNPGFDNYSTCPTNLNQINYADHWTTWSNTPDYFNVCANASHPNVGVPTNNWGSAVPRSGDGYAGLLTYYVNLPSAREFIGGELIQSLIPGQQYFVSFWASRADVDFGSIATNNLGIKFTTVQYSISNPDTSRNFAHVYSPNVIKDSLNWVNIQGSFIADSGYTYFGIGNYFDNQHTTIAPGATVAGVAYYLIEDVCVTTNPQLCDAHTGVTEPVGGIVITATYDQINKELLLFWDNNSHVNDLIIYDITGRVIKEVRTPLPGSRISFTDYSSGIYLVAALGESNAVTKRVLVY